VSVHSKRKPQPTLLALPGEPRHSQGVARLVERAEKAAGRGRPDQALALLEQALDRVPRDAQVLLRIGLLLLGDDDETLSAHRLAGAKDHLREACCVAPWDADTRFAMARCYWKAGQPQRCRAELEATLRCDPEHAGALQFKDEIFGPGRPQKAPRRRPLQLLTGMLRGFKGA